MEDLTYERFLKLLEKLSQATTNLCGPDEWSPDELLQLVRESDELLQELSSFDMRGMDTRSSESTEGSDGIMNRKTQLRLSLQNLLAHTHACKRILEVAAAKSAMDLKSFREIQKARQAYRAMPVFTSRK